MSTPVGTDATTPAAHGPASGSTSVDDADLQTAARSDTGSRPPDIDGKRTVGQLVADASREMSSLVRTEVELAKAEVTGGLKSAGKGAGMLAAAGVLALFGVTFLLHTLARLIAVWLPVWAGYGIVTLILFIVAAVLGLLGKKALSNANPKPEQAIAEAQQTVDAVKASV